MPLVNDVKQGESIGEYGGRKTARARIQRAGAEDGVRRINDFHGVSPFVRPGYSGRRGSIAAPSQSPHASFVMASFGGSGIY